MVTIKIVRTNDNFKEFNISGHANFAVEGQDIVCAAISSICIGLLNAIDEMDKESCDINLDNNLINIKVIKDSQLIQNILNVGYYQLKTIEEKYPLNLKIKSERK